MTYAYNRDCMEAMREFPDGFFDLAVVDPPYGGGSSQSVKVEREREAYAVKQSDMRGTTERASADGLVATISAARTGGTWATKYRQRRRALTFDAGMSRHLQNILMSLQE